ncbi:MAG: hypothetical protein ACRD8U_20010, partial [Pyrinomonadaceae bacterium]
MTKVEDRGKRKVAATRVTRIDKRMAGIGSPIPINVVGDAFSPVENQPRRAAESLNEWRKLSVEMCFSKYVTEATIQLGKFTGQEGGIKQR